MVLAGSHKEVFWKCAQCGQIYKMRVCNRTAPSRAKTTNKCPICLGRIIIPGFNSLKAKFSEMIENDWDYELNTIDPDTIPPHSNKNTGGIVKTDINIKLQLITERVKLA